MAVFLCSNNVQVAAKRTNVPGLKQFHPRRFNPYMGYPTRRPYMPPYFPPPYAYGLVHFSPSLSLCIACCYASRRDGFQCFSLIFQEDAQVQKANAVPAFLSVAVDSLWREGLHQKATAVHLLLIHPEWHVLTEYYYGSIMFQAPFCCLCKPPNRDLIGCLMTIIMNFYSLQFYFGGQIIFRWIPFLSGWIAAIDFSFCKK